MQLIYASTYSIARSFALAQELAAGDWTWIKDDRVVLDYPRSDIYKLPHWDANPHRSEIDAALEHARQKRRLGSVIDYS